MKGFFSDIKNKSIKKNSCGISCLLSSTCKNPKMELIGLGKKKIMIVSDFPSKTEDDTNIRFSGTSGSVVKKVFKKYNIDLDKDCFLTFGVKCHPKESDIPTKKQISSCNDFLIQEIKTHKPELIFLLGEVALETFLKDRWKKDVGSIHKWRGLEIYDREHNCRIIATYSPLWIIKQKEMDMSYKIFENDIKKGLDLLDKPLPIYEDERRFVKVIEDENVAIKFLRRVKQKEKLIAFDFETTGLRPYVKGHRIISFSIAYSEFSCFSCLATPITLKELGNILEDESIKKIASNMKYEHLWAKEILGIEVKGWYWDTMLASHILDNRTGISGLKFQTYIHFGIIDYSSDVESYLNSDGAEFNQIEKAPIKDLLLYNGLDSLFEFRLAKIQMEKMNET